ncbi:LOW QUALITY PROTEIN: cystatin-A-like [Myiozetetes cayanensis]|uniref:LOW QUALITY PROTEIN: cystatin-A-like n=1 Tax=Myiozetetes cayanensis TaxID=478635 RepID=UPI00215F1EBA|nr:LOW QUALITY PROTEIN: cystatin-A-like [Myiozetetes cayanensis]
MQGGLFSARFLTLNSAHTSMCIYMYICKMSGDSVQTAKLPSSEPPVMLKKSRAVGSLSPPEPATQEVQDITNQVKLQLEVKVNGKCDIFRAILYRTQIVAGTIYFIKVQVADTEYVHLKVLLGLPPENVCPALVNFQTGKTRDDPLDYF